MTGILIETAVSDTFLTNSGRPYVMSIRPGSSDWNTANSCSGRHDEYAIPSGQTGWALDIGAHIGAATIPLAKDNPDLRIIAVEALPENAELLRRNVEQNGVGGQVIVVEKAASHNTEPVSIGYGPPEGDPNFHSRFIGNMKQAQWGTIEVAGTSLRELAELRGPDHADPFVWTKLDCESCEYQLLASPLVRLLTFITGEHHSGYDRVEELLSETHEVEMVDGTPDFGHFVAHRRGNIHP